MMRKAAVVALLPLLTAALGAQAIPIRGQRITGIPGSSGAERSLTVKVLPPEPHAPLRYVVSEPAYVAAFVIYPGAGVRLLYPDASSAERVQWAGYHTEQLFQAHFDNDLYDVVLGPTRSVSGGPAYLYVIASRYPLDVGRYVHRPMQLANAVGRSSARSFYADVAFDALVGNALSLGDDESWDADVYMLWPSSMSDRSAAQVPRISLRCSNGLTMIVPANYPFIGCPGDARLVPRAAQSATPVQQTASVEHPTVLPTIVGARRMPTPPNGKTAPQVTAFTAVTGVTNGTRAEASNAPTAVTIVEQPILLDRARFREHGEALRETHQRLDPGDRNERGGRDGHDRDFPRERARDRGQDDGRAGAPRLAPPPQLAPAPRLAPNPQSAPQQESAPRIERSAPPMGVPATSAPSGGHAAVNASGGAPATPRTAPVNQQ